MTRADRITLAEAAERLGVHYMTAYRYVRTGRLAAEREGVQWIVDPADLEAARRSAAPGRRPRSTAAARSATPARLAARMVAGDEAGAWALVQATLTGGAEPAQIYDDILVPALRDIGDRWEHGSLTVADEHRASGIAQRLVGRLGPLMTTRGPKRGTIILGAPTGELHALPCAILADLLRKDGFHVEDLGANTPAESFMHAAQSSNRLIAILLGATTTGQEKELRAVTRGLRRANIDAPVLVGGAAIADEATALALGADGWTGLRSSTARASVEGLIALNT